MEVRPGLMSNRYMCYKIHNESNMKLSHVKIYLGKFRIQGNLTKTLKFMKLRPELCDGFNNNYYYYNDDDCHCRYYQN